MESSSQEISALDPENKNLETKLQRLVINGLHVEHVVYVAVIAGWKNNLLLTSWRIKALSIPIL